MAKFMSYITGNSGKATTVGRIILWMLLLAVFIPKVFPLVSYSYNFISTSFSSVCTIIKQRPFVYVIINFIIVTILIFSSSFTLKLNNFLQKIQRKSSHNISSLISQTSRKLSLSWDEDSWWHKIVHSQETDHHFPPVEESSSVEHTRYKAEEEHETVSVAPRGVEKQQEVQEEENQGKAHEDEDYYYDDYGVESRVEEEDHENDTLDDTWRGIMEAKNKGEPYLKKCGTWTSGDRGGGGAVEKKPMGRLAKCKTELKKWRTFSRDVVVHEKNEFRGGGYDSGGRKQKEVALTYHDELKKRSDAFIARFTNDMRLQRLESQQRLLELEASNRGGY